MAPGLIQEECDIEDVSIKAIADCRAAASVVTWEFAYSVYKGGEAVWREGASNLLSLHGFRGMHVHIYETYFAAKVKAFDTVFDQVFFIVDKVVHPILLGLLAMMAARMCLLTVISHDVMPEMKKALSLSFQPAWHQQKAAQSLNYLVDLMRQQPVEMKQTWAWETLSLGDFSLQQVNLLMDRSLSPLHD